MPISIHFGWHCITPPEYIPNTAQDLHSTKTPTRLVTHCTHFTSQTYIQSAGTISLVLHNKLRGHDINLAGTHKQVHVLTDYWCAWVSIGIQTKSTTFRFPVSIKRTTGFTHEYLPLVNYYLQQKCTAGVTREYFHLVSNHSWAVYSSCCTSPTHELPSKFLKARRVTHVFVNVSYTIVNLTC